MLFRGRANDPSFVLIRVSLAILVGFAALIAILLIVRPNMMIGMLHGAMTAM